MMATQINSSGFDNNPNAIAFPPGENINDAFDENQGNQ